MRRNTATLGIYAIQDVNNSTTPNISHDHGIAIMQNGEVKKLLQLERINRHKYSNLLHEELFTILKKEKLLNKDYDIIFTDNVLGRSFINKEGNIRFEAVINKPLQNGIEKGNCTWIGTTKEAYIINHELAHIGSCLPFYGSFKNNSLLIHYDGGASKSNFSAWHYIDNKIKPICYDWDLKKVTSIFNANALMFGILNSKQSDVNSVPGKLMGFASFGKYDSKIDEWLNENNFFNDIWKSKREFFDKTEKDFGISINHLSQKDNFIQNIAASAHEYFIKESFNRIRDIQNEIKAYNLYYSGGTALSIVLNTKIEESGLFKNTYIPPCCSDSGLALGAAAFFEWEKGNEIKIHSPYLNNWGIEDYKTKVDPIEIENIANSLAEGKIIGICNSYGEIGPRALGNRSILCIASDKDLAKKVSTKIKKREWYRPIAPIMLKSNARYFTEKEKISALSKLMLLEYEIPALKRKELAGAIHIDNTARIQTIEKAEDNPFMYELLTKLNSEHKIRALINTSFNVAGEPIVHTEDDAIKSAKNMKLDGVVLNGKLVELEC